MSDRPTPGKGEVVIHTKRFDRWWRPWEAHVTIGPMSVGPAHTGWTEEDAIRRAERAERRYRRRNVAVEHGEHRR